MALSTLFVCLALCHFVITDVQTGLDLWQSRRFNFTRFSVSLFLCARNMNIAFYLRNFDKRWIVKRYVTVPKLILTGNCLCASDRWLKQFLCASIEFLTQISIVVECFLIMHIFDQSMHSSDITNTLANQSKWSGSHRFGCDSNVEIERHSLGHHKLRAVDAFDDANLNCM